jgi:hypothetical protein
MKSNLSLTITDWLALAALAAFSLQPSSARAQGTAFTYQGQLQNNGSPASGLYDVRFLVWDALTSGHLIAGPLTNAATGVTNGLFTVTLDFGPGVFTGPGRWLELDVRTNGNAAFTPLLPLQPLLATPYAMMANTASNLLGTLPMAQLSGTVANSQLANSSITVSAGSGLSGGGTVSLGGATTLNNTGVLSIAGNADITTSAANGVITLGDTATSSNTGGTIVKRDASGNFSAGGAGLTGLNASQLTTGAVPILALGNAWTTAGNAGTTSGANFVGTTDNQPLEFRTYNTRALRLDDVGGVPNLTVNPYANTIATYGSTIAGGYANQIQANAEYSVIAGGYQNQIQTNAYYSVIAGGYQNQIQSQGSEAAIYGVIGGGTLNVLGPYAWYSFVAGGYYNHVGYNANYVAILGGSGNVIGTNVNYSMIGGGSQNNLFNGASGVLIAGGQGNFIGNYADNSVIAGGQGNSIGDSWLGALGAGGSTGSTISGGIHNTVAGWNTSGEFTFQPATDSTIAGGAYNKIQGSSTGVAIGGGIANFIAGPGSYSVISGGGSNSTYATYATVGGGVGNNASASGAFIGGGGYDGSTFSPNIASGPASAIVGGTANQASAPRSSIGGGHDNSASGWYSTVPGGAWNVAGGTGSFAAGQAAHATYDGSFVWNCDYANTLTTTAGSQFMARADGGFYFYTGTAGGATLLPGSGSWTSLSDRNAKENFAPVNAESVLDKVAALPLSTWNYKEQDRSIRHLGPMAQDFKAAFGVGETDTGITTVDADGVALAAIQGLNQKLNEKDAEIQDLKQSVAKLKAMVEELAGK